MTRPLARSCINRSFLNGGPGGGVGGGSESLESSVGVSVERVGGSVETVSIRLVGLRVLTVGRAAILLMYFVVAENVDPGILDVRTKFSSSSMPVLRLLNRVLKPDRMDS